MKSGKCKSTMSHLNQHKYDQQRRQGNIRFWSSCNQKTSFCGPHLLYLSIHSLLSFTFDSCQRIRKIPFAIHKIGESSTKKNALKSRGGVEYKFPHWGGLCHLFVPFSSKVHSRKSSLGVSYSHQVFTKDLLCEKSPRIQKRFVRSCITNILLDLKVGRAPHFCSVSIQSGVAIQDCNSHNVCPQW